MHSVADARLGAWDADDGGEAPAKLPAADERLLATFETRVIAYCQRTETPGQMRAPSQADLAEAWCGSRNDGRVQRLLRSISEHRDERVRALVLSRRPLVIDVWAFDDLFGWPRRQLWISEVIPITTRNPGVEPESAASPDIHPGKRGAGVGDLLNVLAEMNRLLGEQIRLLTTLHDSVRDDGCVCAEIRAPETPIARKSAQESAQPEHVMVMDGEQNHPSHAQKDTDLRGSPRKVPRKNPRVAGRELDALIANKLGPAIPNLWKELDECCERYGLPRAGPDMAGLIDDIKTLGRQHDLIEGGFLALIKRINDERCSGNEVPATAANNPFALLRKDQSLYRLPPQRIATQPAARRFPRGEPAYPNGNGTMAQLVWLADRDCHEVQWLVGKTQDPECGTCGSCDCDAARFVGQELKTEREHDGSE